MDPVLPAAAGGALADAGLARRPAFFAFAMVFLTVFAGRFERASQAPAVPGAPVTGIELPVQANATTRNCMSANAHGANRQAVMPPLGFGASDPCETLGFPCRNLTPRRVALN